MCKSHTVDLTHISSSEDMIYTCVYSGLYFQCLFQIKTCIDYFKVSVFKRTQNIHGLFQFFIKTSQKLILFSLLFETHL